MSEKLPETRARMPSEPPTSPATAPPGIELTSQPASPFAAAAASPPLSPPPPPPAAAPAAASKKKGPPPVPSVSFTALFRYATPLDIVLNCVALLAAACGGIVFPLFAILFGSLLSAFNGSSFSTTLSNQYALWFLLIALGMGVCSLLDTTLVMYTAERQIRRVREEYMRALLRQEIAYFDVNKAGEMAARMTEDSLSMSDAMATKMTTSVRYSVTFIGGIAVGFASSWQLTLVMLGA